MKKQWIALFLLSFTLSACIGNNDSNKDSDKDNRVALPDINPNLSTESPEGIWMLHMDIDMNETAIGSFGQKDVDDSYFIRQLATIQGIADSNKYEINSYCGDSSDLNSNSAIIATQSDSMIPYEWEFSEDQLRSFSSPPDNFSRYWKMFYPELLWQSQEEGQLSFKQNLTITGNISHKILVNYEPSERYNSDPYVIIPLSGAHDIKYNKIMKISGVKISDSIHIDDAPELAYTLNIQSEDLSISNITSQLFCLKSNEKTSKITTTSSEKNSMETQSIQALNIGINSSPEEETLYFGVRKYLQADLTSLYLDQPKSNSYHSISTCPKQDLNENCQSPVKFDLTLDSKSKNSFSTKADIVGHDGEEIRTDFSLLIQP